jgi:formate hydrogenlyase transcriptional activator
VRVIAATNRDIEGETRAGRFRADLYHRLAAFPLHVPTLKERHEDIPLLASHFADAAGRRLGLAAVHFTDRARRQLEAGDWPGNIRELENVLERAVILAAGPILEIGADTLTSQPEPAKMAQATLTLEQMERNHLETVLEKTDWVIEGPRGAAKILGLHPNTLRSRLKKIGLTRTSHEPS